MGGENTNLPKDSKMKICEKLRRVGSKAIKKRERFTCQIRFGKLIH